MHPIASIVVAAHINDLLAESANARLARSAQAPKARSGIASRFSSVWSAVSGTATSPKLTDYPFRS